jgi:hypothetical protein
MLYVEFNGREEAGGAWETAAEKSIDDTVEAFTAARKCRLSEL